MILHLAASQSLRHIFPADARPPLWQCGLLVLIVSLVLVQVRALADLSIIFLTGEDHVAINSTIQALGTSSFKPCKLDPVSHHCQVRTLKDDLFPITLCTSEFQPILTTCSLITGTASQLVAIAVVVFILLTNPDPDANHSFQSVSWSTLIPTAISVGAIVFAFGGQFAFVEVQASMKKPQDFPKAVNLCTLLMGGLYLAVGVVGWWSKGDKITEILIFSLEDTPLVRFAAGCILLQAISQYLINLNVWLHNLLTLVSRSFPKEGITEAQCSQEQVYSFT